MSKYEGLYTFDDNHRYIPVGQGERIINRFKEPLIKEIKKNMGANNVLV